MKSNSFARKILNLFCLSFIGVFIVFLVCSWVLYDAERNERIYHDTDNTVTEMEERIAEQKQDLTMLSNEAAGLRTNLQTLKQNIDKERRVHKRQVWQNRIWSILIGAGILSLIMG